MPQPQPRPLIVDTDGGTDDAQALLAALADGARTRLLGVTAVAGNVALDDAVRNVCACLAAAGRASGDVPVFRGAARPLVQEPGAGAAEWHGPDGLGGTGFGAAASAAPVREGEHAALAIIRLVQEANAAAAAAAAAAAGGGRGAAAARPTRVTLGPLTNIALALRLWPALAEGFERVVVMAGAYQSRGNTGAATPGAEFNALADPEALAVVLGGFPRVQLVTWELTLRSGLPEEFVERWMRGGDSGSGGGGGGAAAAPLQPRAALSPRAAFLTAVFPHLRAASAAAAGSAAAFAESGFFIPDPLAMAVALRPECVAALAGGRPRRVTVVLAPGAARGTTLVDWDAAAEGNVAIVERVDMEVVRGLLLASTR